MLVRQVLWNPLRVDYRDVAPLRTSKQDTLLERSALLDLSCEFASSALKEMTASVGQTPLVEVPSDEGGARIYAKLEYLNAFGTIKARTAIGLIGSDLRSDPATPMAERHYLTYGGATFHYPVAVISKLLGARCSLYSGTFLTEEQIALVRSWGADLTLVDKERGFWAIIEETVAKAKENPGWRFLFQHEDPANFEIHEESTGAELVAQVSRLAGRGGDLAAFVASVGTGGTIYGVQRAFSKMGIAPELAVVSPAEQVVGHYGPQNGFPKIAGSGGMGYGRRQLFLKLASSSVKYQFSVAYQDALLAMRELAEVAGTYVGTSAAANWLSARALAVDLSPNQYVLTVFPSEALPSEVVAARSIQWGEH